MSRTLFLGLLVCILGIGLSLFVYIDSLNHVTALRLKIPDLEKDVNDIREENKRLKYEIDSFESPLHLMELMLKPEYGHLKHPNVNQIFIIPKGKTIQETP